MKLGRRIRRIRQHDRIFILGTDSIRSVQFTGRSLVKFDVIVEMADDLQEAGSPAGINFRGKQREVKRISDKTLRRQIVNLMGIRDGYRFKQGRSVRKVCWYQCNFAKDA